MTGLGTEPLPAESAQQPPSRRARRAARRDARWSRPKPPKDWRYWVGGTGRLLVTIGLLMFGFVAYQLWGTGIEYARAQDRLDREFEELLASASTVTSPPSPTPTTVGAPATTTTTTTTTSAAPTVPGVTVDPAATTSTTLAATTTTAPTTTTVPATVPVPEFEDGTAFARLEIPRLGRDDKIVAGVTPGDLKEGPGHYPDTPMPGQLGNSAIAGHRTTYGQPFYRLNELEPGDEIVVTTIQGRFVYRVTGSEIVGAKDGHVVATTDPTVARLTLTTCHPRYTARDRLIVYAELDTAQSGPGLPPVIRSDEAPSDTLPGEETPASTTPPSPAASAPTGTAVEVTPPTTFAGDDPTVTTEPSPATTVPGPGTADEDGGSDESVDAFSHGWFDDGAAWPHVAMWGLAAAAIALGGWLLARRFRRYWVGASAAILPFAVTLFFFYQNVNRLLPAAI